MPNPSLPHLLVVDDDTRIRELLTRYLGEQGFAVSAAANAAEARQAMGQTPFDLMVLDIMMPGETGLSLARNLPVGAPPVLLLSAMSEAEDRIGGLEAGAEDYLTKPFEPKELLLRIRAILRRAETRPRKAAAVSFGPFRFETENGALTRDGQAVRLTSGETAMLKLLAATPGQPVSREALAAATLAPAGERSVDVQITRLRKKIEEEGMPSYIQTVRHAGYTLSANPDSPGAV